MSRKHFQALAAEIAKITDYTTRRAAADAVGRACDLCYKNFNWRIFYEACNV